MPRNFGWSSYHTFDEIYEWMDELVESNNGTLSHISAGFSHEGRAIRGVKLSHGTVINLINFDLISYKFKNTNNFLGKKINYY